MIGKKKNVFIIGLDEFNLDKLNRLPEAPGCNFLPALEFSEIRGIDKISIPEMIQRIDARVAQAGSIDAVASYYDFPGSVLVPIIAEKYDLPGPSLESILKCENKYWSRLEQQKVIPEHIPQFLAFDPFDEQAYDKIGFVAPFWIKPIKSFHSYLAFRINDETQFKEHLEEIRREINFMSDPFSHIMSNYGLPQEFGSMQESMIAETTISGHQCTLEGYALENEVTALGIVDSIREADRSSFIRYEYPSSLPQEIQFRMVDIARRVISQIGLSNGAFNIEFFYNETADQVYLLEINPRISQAHTDIFEKVHGISHHYVMLNLALNRKPKPLTYNGDFRVAAHFMLRSYEPGIVTKVPSEAEIRRMKEKYPDLSIKINVEEGTDLETIDMHHVDSYSFILANLHIGAKNRGQLLEKYQDVIDNLPFTIENTIPGVFTR